MGGSGIKMSVHGKQKCGKFIIYIHVVKFYKGFECLFSFMRKCTYYLPETKLLTVHGLQYDVTD